MSKHGSAYGQAASDTDFRTKPDLAAAAARAAEREASERQERKAHYEAKLAGKKYHISLSGNEAFSTARVSSTDFRALVGTSVLVPAGAGVGRRGRGAGFYCEACDLTYKDNKQYVDHCNSVQHQVRTGQSGRVRKASAKEVHERVNLVWERLQEVKKEETVDLEKRLQVRAEVEAKEREERRQRKKEAEERRKREREEREKEKLQYGEDVRIEGEHEEDDMLAALGISGFGSTKKG